MHTDRKTWKVYTYTLRFAGLYGRNRKPKQDSTELVEIPEEKGPLSEEAVRALMTDAIRTLKPKGVLNVAVVESLDTIEEQTYPPQEPGGDPIVMRSRMITFLGGRVVLKEQAGTPNPVGN